MSRLPPACGTAPAFPGAALGRPLVLQWEPTLAGALEEVTELPLGVVGAGARAGSDPESGALGGLAPEITCALVLLLGVGWSSGTALEHSSLWGSSSRRLRCWHRLQRELCSRAARRSRCVPRAALEQTECNSVALGSGWGLIQSPGLVPKLVLELPGVRGLSH